MKNMEKRIVVYLDKKLAEWLDEKTHEGYKKASLIRKALRIFMESEEDAKEYLGQLKLSDAEKATLARL